MANIATLSSTSTHGGAPSSSASKVFAKSSNVVRRGDNFSCPIHGTRTISAGSATVDAENSDVARHGDAISCGATLVSTITDVQVG